MIFVLFLCFLQQVLIRFHSKEVLAIVANSTAHETKRSLDTRLRADKREDNVLTDRMNDDEDLDSNFNINSPLYTTSRYPRHRGCMHYVHHKRGAWAGRGVLGKIDPNVLKRGILRFIFKNGEKVKKVSFVWGVITRLYRKIPVISRLGLYNCIRGLQ
jgi:hypothetical protein